VNSISGLLTSPRKGEAPWKLGEPSSYPLFTGFVVTGVKTLHAIIVGTQLSSYSTSMFSRRH
jgi:hypothetical protein